MSCGVLEKVVNKETGEEFTLIQLEVTDPYTVILKGEGGQIERLPVDLLVCSTCKSKVYALGLDTFLCEKDLGDIYERTGKTPDVLFNGIRFPGPSLLNNNNLDGR